MGVKIEFYQICESDNVRSMAIQDVLFQTALFEKPAVSQAK